MSPMRFVVLALDVASSAMTVQRRSFLVKIGSQNLSQAIAIGILFFGNLSIASDNIKFLENILNEPPPVKKVYEFLQRLHDQKQMPVGFLSLYKSNAAHSYNISRENPRIILKWKDSVLAFNGARNELEVIDFNSKTKKFELYQYLFDKPDKNGKHYSEKNQKRCLDCHANSVGDPIPIYDGYNTWPGYYGTNDGQIQGKEWQDYHKFKVLHGIHDLVNQDKAIHNKDVYSYLIDWDQVDKFDYQDPNGSRTLDHYKPMNCDPKILGGAPADQKTAGKNKEDIRYRFVDFGRFLYSKHQEYVAHHKVFGTMLEPYRYAILGAVLCPSDDFDERSFLTDSLKNVFKTQDFDDLVQETKEITSASYAHKVKGVHRDLNVNGDKNERTQTVIDSRAKQPRLNKDRSEVTEYDQDLRRLEGFKAIDGSGRTGPYSAGYKGSAETYGIYARVRLIVEKVAGQKMDWSMSRKALKSEYEDEDSWEEKLKDKKNPTMRRLSPHQKLIKWKRAPKEQQVSGSEDYNFGQGCFDFERPESWRFLLSEGEVSADDKNADTVLLSLLDKAMTNIRPKNGLDKYGGYILSPERQTFCKALQGRSRMVLKRYELPTSAPGSCPKEERGFQDIDQISSLVAGIKDKTLIEDQAHTQRILLNGKELVVKLEKKGHLYRSIDVPKLGKIQFYKDEAAIAVTHLQNNDAPVLRFQTSQCRWYNCDQLVFSNGDSVSLTQKDANKLQKLFQF